MAEQDQEMMTVMDPNGKPMRILRKDWAEKILPETLRRLKDEPDGLHVMLVGALREGFAQNQAVGEGVARLREIDKNVERSTVVKGIYLMQTGKTGEAERLFDEYLSQHGDSGVILTNLAKLYFERGEKERAEETLQRALKINPNLDSAMAWWTSAQRERGGEEGYLAALRQLADQPGSWRPQLWLARYALKNKNVEEAMNLYRQVVAEGHVTPDGYVQITGDLGAAGEMGRMLELMLPIYDPRKHGPITGFNLINGLAQMGRMEEAKELFRKLKEEKNPGIAPLLADVARRLGLGAASAAGAATAAGGEEAGQRRVQVAAVPLLNPVWTPPLQRPKWLVPAKPDGLRVAFFSLADSTRAVNQPAPSQEPASSRLTRSLPIYLSESLRLRTNAMTVCIIPVMAERGAVVTGTPWPLQQMLEACPGEFQPEIVVCGVVARGARGGRVEFHLFRVNDRQPLKTVRIAAGENFTGTALAAEAEITQFLGESGVKKVESELKAPRQLDNYLNCLDDLLMDMLVATGVTQADGRANGREGYEKYFALARSEEETPLPTLVAAAGVLAGMKFAGGAAGSYR
ncbi:MAG TPA: tetratricopeptide repeat protein, partial [Tepidisphaeraceae bacterium]|nr:tetratricopeptide repeat protein [Tepidisphaeraceae bacterium]